MCNITYFMLLFELLIYFQNYYDTFYLPFFRLFSYKQFTFTLPPKPRKHKRFVLFFKLSCNFVYASVILKKRNGFFDTVFPAYILKQVFSAAVLVVYLYIAVAGIVGRGIGYNLKLIPEFLEKLVVKSAYPFAFVHNHKIYRSVLVGRSPVYIASVG